MKPWDDERDAVIRRQNLAHARRVWRELVHRAQRRLWSTGDFLPPLHVDLDAAMNDESDQESGVAGASGNSRLESSNTTKTR